VDTPERCAIGHTHVGFKRSNGETLNGILERKILSENAHRAKLTTWLTPGSLVAMGGWLAEREEHRTRLRLQLRLATGSFLHQQL
jgi:hypothetical protein